MNDATDYVSPTERVKAWTDGAVLHIRFNNPAKHNALSVDMWEALPALLEQGEKDHGVRLVVLSGEGGKAFVSGADISQFADLRAAKEAVVRYEHVAESALRAIQEFGKPTIACIRGYCLGGGLNVAIACDIRIASSDSVFAIPAARLGLGYRLSAMKSLVDLVGPGRAKEIFFTARRLGAEEALRMGLVNRVCEPGALDELLEEFTRAIADGAPLTIRAGKRIIAEALKPAADLDVELCRRLTLACFESEDYAEGRRAFMEKRKPEFKGK